ncbi:MAG TPA: CHAT domain-containing tetratricopeptide repeat protein, partial [Steroidobacteraceae bacterium]|nr:CHAT domain-containing tetratricopeptide repeat protein [Steroidobacteraceae bacterium]
RLARWQRAAGAPPGELEKGYAALAAAGELTAKKTPADSQKAVDKIHEAISHFDTARATAARADARYSLANLLYLERNDFAGTLRAAREAADDFDALDDETGVQSAETIRAAAELELALSMDASRQGAEQKAMYGDADRRLQASAEYFLTHGLPVRAAYAINMRGVRGLYVADYEAAEKFFARVVDMTRADHDTRQQAIALANLAWVHNRLGFFTQAAAEYAALLPMIEKDKEPYQYAVAIANYGFCLIMLGDFDRALALHNEALSLYVAQGKEAERATELSALGSLYFRIGDTRRALDILRMAVAAHERLGNASAQAAALRVAGNASSALGEHQEALGYLRRSSQIDATPYTVARTRVLVAAELRELGDLRGAEAELARAFDSHIPLVRADALVERARLRLTQREPRQAVSDLRAADREYLAIGLEFNRIETNTELSRALLAIGEVADASAAADEAVAIAGRIRAKSANPEWRARFVSSRYSPWEARIAADFAAGGTAAAWQAFRTAEQVRARSLADQLAVGPRSAPSLAEAENLRARLTSLQLSLESRIQKLDLDDPELVELRRNVAETRAKLDAARASVTAQELALPESIEVVQSALPPDTAVLEFFVGDNESHAWLLTRTALRHHRLPGLDRLQKEVTSVLGTRGSATGQLGKLLLGSVLAGIDANRMLIIADGPLNAVPFAAIPADGEGSQLLIDRFVLAYAPSLSLAMSGSKQAARRHHSRIAVVSDPVYAPDDRRLQLALGKNGGLLRGPVETPPSNLTRLPYSGLEARAVLDAMGRQEAITLDGFEATPARVYALPFGDLAVLHFATHASARPDSPEQSALYLSEYAADGTRITDSRITAGEIAQGGLRADVVVLSGCATGDGSELRGEGVLGLTYGFLANGSGAVVASLWPIEDASTARFMKEFYGAYRAKAQPAEALRMAQLRSRGVVAGAVWASFVVRANGFP